jgi:hypothetical protein
MLSFLTMTPAHLLMPSALAVILRKAPLTPEKVAFAWRAAVGPAVDKATSVELQTDVLRVRAKDATWRREVERSSPLILARLQTLLGDGVVRFIDVKERDRRGNEGR